MSDIVERLLTQAQLKEALEYNPDTGIFTHRRTVSCGIKPGRQAGSVAKNGYVRIQLNSRSYAAHRLAWLYVHGFFPPGDIDHINGNPTDNRLVNLRPASRSENMQNVGIRASNTTGYTGVHFRGGVGRVKIWRAEIMVNGSLKRLGYFHTIEEAAAARKSAERQFHPFKSQEQVTTHD